MTDRRHVLGGILLAGFYLTTAPQPSSAQQGLEELTPLIGTWRSHLDARYADHPAIRRFNPELKGQELIVAWGASREVVHVRVVDLDRPSPGDRTTLIEGIVILNPDTKEIEFASYNSIDDQYYRGVIDVDEEGNIRREYTTFFAAGPPTGFRELWEWTDAAKTSFDWYTERRVDGAYQRVDIVVRWDRAER